jgi:hypothetical protein
MSKDETIGKVNALEKELKRLEASIKQIKSQQVGRSSVKENAAKIARVWFEEIEPALTRFMVVDATIQKYHAFFDKILSLSLAYSRKATYLSTISAILQDLRKEILLPIIKSSEKILSITNLSKILEQVTEDEREYLTEAIGCAEHGYLRASIVLGWDAAINRMQEIIGKYGFEEFNKKTEEMKNKTEGRFKRFNKSFKIQSLSELRATVFDNDLLWILEYMGLIDSNQHDRLSLCFTMRNNCAHPGEAPLSVENLASFYSDIKNIIFDNPKFKL